ncbi:hypothetical protein GCM10009867_26370 [Pedococcus aerophilus]|uniref:Uncharacterized protein n=1 Tax=Pedococcus aerophilus TaxID=436356 RepID=A0ABN3US26_9MICO
MPPEVDGAREGEPTHVEDRGSFSHAVCHVCGWTGPGRRARQGSRRDAAKHLDERHSGAATDDGRRDDRG